MAGLWDNSDDPIMDKEEMTHEQISDDYCVICGASEATYNEEHQEWICDRCHARSLADEEYARIQAAHAEAMLRNE